MSDNPYAGIADVFKELEGNALAGLRDLLNHDPPPTPPLTVEMIERTMREIAEEPLFKPDPPEIVNPEEYRWRMAHPGSTHYDYWYAIQWERQPHMVRAWAKLARDRSSNQSGRKR